MASSTPQAEDSDDKLTFKDFVALHYVGLHYVVAAAVTAAYIIADWLSHDVLFGNVAQATRSATYVSAAATSGALLGFTITMVTVLITLSGGERMTSLMANPAFTYVRPVTMGAVRTLAVSTLVFTVLIVLDTRDNAEPVSVYVGVFFAVMVVARVWAVVTLMAKLLQISINDKAAIAARKEELRVKRSSPPPFDEPEDDPPAGGVTTA